MGLIAVYLMYSDAQHIVLFSVFNEYLFRILNKGNLTFYVKRAQVRNNRIRVESVLSPKCSYFHSCKNSSNRQGHIILREE